MKLVKFVLIFIFVFILTGCNRDNNIEIIENNSVKYNLNIDKTFKENIIFSFKNDEVEIANDEVGDDYVSIKDHIINNNINSLYYEDNAFYNKKVKKNKNSTNIELSYEYTEEEFTYPKLIMSCFENYEIVSKDDYFEINLFGKFSCLSDMDKIDINIITNYNVEDTNGEKLDNKYHWIINKENYDYSYIKFKVNRNYNDMDNQVVKGNNNNSFMGVIKLVVLFVSMFIVYKIYCKIKIKFDL